MPRWLSSGIRIAETSSRCLFRLTNRADRGVEYLSAAVRRRTRMTTWAGRRWWMFSSGETFRRRRTDSPRGHPRHPGRRRLTLPARVAVPVRRDETVTRTRETRCRGFRARGRPESPASHARLLYTSDADLDGALRAYRQRVLAIRTTATRPQARQIYLELAATRKPPPSSPRAPAGPHERGSLRRPRPDPAAPGRLRRGREVGTSRATLNPRTLPPGTRSARR